MKVLSLVQYFLGAFAGSVCVGLLVTRHIWSFGIVAIASAVLSESVDIFYERKVAGR